MNPKENSKVAWISNNLKLTVNEIDPSEPSQESYFITNYAVTLHRAVTNKCDVTNFHFHAPSEHTLNGDRLDIELHVNHAWDTELKDLVLTKTLIGVWFSVDNYDRSLSHEST